MKEGIAKLESVPEYTAVAEDGTPAVYVFNAKDGEGYKIVSADDSAVALLGYSDRGSVNSSDMAPGLQWWLSETAKLISANASKGIASKPRAAGNGQPAIAPLCASKWNQDAPYNNDAPTNGGRCYTGCVATSMAQVMYYHKYPEVGEGSNSYKWGGTGRTLTMDFSEQPFDWGNMIDVYQRGSYTAEQAAAVAYLMKACGYSVNMDYGTDASGTQGALIANALRTYFKYDGNCHVDYRMGYSASQWDTMVYNNLKNCGPIIFNGHPYEDGGHSFICDGYDGNGYYHFNWGWGGVSDGYYLLEVMNPEGQGIGGASSTGFVYGLNGIFGIQKPTGEPVEVREANLLMYGGCYAEVNGDKISFYRNRWYPDGWYNSSDKMINVFTGIIFTPIDGTPGESEWVAGGITGSAGLKLGVGYYLATDNGPSVKIPALANGRYKAYIGVRDRDIEGSTPHPVISSYGTPNFVYLTVNNGVYTVENVPVPKLAVENAKILTPLYYNMNCQINLKLNNTSDYEMTESLAVVLAQNGNNKYTTGGQPLTVNPKNSQELSFVGKFVSMSGVKAPSEAGEYDLRVMNPVTQEILGTFGKVTLQPRTSNTSLFPSKFEFDGCEAVSEDTDFGNVKVYQVPTERFTYLLDYKVNSGFFDGVIGLSIYEPSPEGDREMIPVIENFYMDQPFLEEGESGSISIPYQFKEAVDGALYAIRATYSKNNRFNTLVQTYFRVLENSGVQGIESDTEPARYYNLQGIEVTSPEKGELLIEVKGEKSRKIIY